MADKYRAHAEYRAANGDLLAQCELERERLLTDIAELTALVRERMVRPVRTSTLDPTAREMHAGFCNLGYGAQPCHPWCQRARAILTATRGVKTYDG